MRLLFWGHLGNIHKTDEELVHVSPTRSREMAAELSKLGYDVTAAIYWPQFEQEISPTLRYVHVDKIDADDYDIVFCHLRLSIDQIAAFARGDTKAVSRNDKYGHDAERFQKILDHPQLYLQLDAPRALSKDPTIDIDLVNRFKCVGVATQNAVAIWKKMYPLSNVEWVNAATIAYKYPEGKNPYVDSDSNKKKVIYLGRMNDASGVTPLDKIHFIAARLPDVEFHIVTNKIRDGKTTKVYAINELQGGSAREIRFHDAGKLIKGDNIFLHRGSLYKDSFDWMHYADCAIGFTVRPGQDVASCKSWEYYGTGVPVVLEEDTPETWILGEIAQGKVAKFQNWNDFAAKIEEVLQTPYKRRKMRKYIRSNHGYDSRAKQWQEIIERHR